MTPDEAEQQHLLAVIREMQRAIRDRVVQACESQAMDDVAAVSSDADGDTQFAIDEVGEEAMLAHLEPVAKRFSGFVLVAEGLEGGSLVLPRDSRRGSARYQIIVDPIDGTRSIMYQKRSAWVLTAVAPNRGAVTELRDALFACQTEIPILKQNLCDELWAVKGKGAHAERYDRISGKRVPLDVSPSKATSIEQGYAMISRFFPGARDELAAIDEALIKDVLGPTPEGKALCFEDQYASTGGQLYELMMGHDRFNADLRPMMGKILQERGLPKSLCCHPYDVCTALIAEEAGVILNNPHGSRLNAPLNLEADVAWVAYANEALRRQIEPKLRRVLQQRRLL